jgi:hypothetical protein
MSLHHSSKTVTDGLLFYYDMANIQKSWRGAPATNLWTETNLINWTKTAIVSTSTFRTPFDTAAYVITDDNTSDWENVNRSVTIPADSSSYTMSCMVRKTIGGTSARLGFNISFSGGTAVSFSPRFNSDTGAATSGTVIDYGDWWYWYFTGTNNGTNTTYNAAFYSATGVHNGSDNSTATGTAIVGAFMLVSGSTAIRFANGTRSTSQAVLDLTGRTTTTTNNLTYNNDNTFNFSSASDTSTITLPLSTSFNKLTGTIGMWVNPVSYSGSNGLFVNRADNTPNATDWFWIGSWDSGNVFYFRLGDGTTCCNNDLTISGWTTLCPINTWTYVTFSWLSGGQSRIYTNGVLQASRTISPIPATNPSTSGRIGLGHGGGGCWNGKISTTQIYNRQLTDAEIFSNYNALKGRYSL